MSHLQCERDVYNDYTAYTGSEVAQAAETSAVQAVSRIEAVQVAQAEHLDFVVTKSTNVETLRAIEAIEQYAILSEVPLSEDLQTVMQEACAEYNVPYSLALAVAETESTFDVDADNGLCVGLMQINRCNHEWLCKLGIEPTEHDGNIVAGVLMLGQLLEKYQDTHKALMAYNCGETGAALEERLLDKHVFAQSCRSR